MAFEKFRYHGKLVALCHTLHGNLFDYYLKGDLAEPPRKVAVLPVGVSEIIEDIPFEMPLSERLALFEAYAPKAANAFITGRQIPSHRQDRAYNLPIHYFAIDEEDWSRAQLLEHIDTIFPGMFRPLEKPGDPFILEP
ncbi:MAG: hypothetical protein IT445_06235 [Phycisphaeraceae bacterium]|nr:hypothetical protein [Phycisphaeraceae bacterium]